MIIFYDLIIPTAKKEYQIKNVLLLLKDEQCCKTSPLVIE